MSDHQNHDHTKEQQPQSSIPAVDQPPKKSLTERIEPILRSAVQAVIYITRVVVSDKFVRLLAMVLAFVLAYYAQQGFTHHYFVQRSRTFPVTNLAILGAGVVAFAWALRKRPWPMMFPSIIAVGLSYWAYILGNRVQISQRLATSLTGEGNAWDAMRDRLLQLPGISFLGWSIVWAPINLVRAVLETFRVYIIPCFEQEFYGWAFLSWLLAMTVLVIGAIWHDLWRLDVERHPPCKPSQHPRRWVVEAVLLSLVLLFGALVVFPYLEEIPPYIDGDEGRQGLYAVRDILRDGRTFPNVFAFGWNNLPNLTYVIENMYMFTFGANIKNFRLSTATMGFLTLPFLYLFARRLWGVRIALIATFLLAISRNHLEWSRIAASNIQTLTCQMVCLWFLARAIVYRRWADWMACGIFTGIGLNLYHGSKMVPVIFLVFFACAVCTQRGFWRTQRYGLGLWGVGVFASFLPLFLWTVDNYARIRTAFNDRLLTNNLMDMINQGQYANVWTTLLNQTWDTIWGLTVRHGTLPFGYSGALVDHWTAVPMLLGIGYMFWRIKDIRHQLILVWLVVSLFMGSVLAINPPHHPRLVGIFPVLALLAALALAKLVKPMKNLFGKWGEIPYLLCLVPMLGLAAHENIKNYYIDFPLARGSDTGTQITKYLGTLPEGSFVTVFGAEYGAEWFDTLTEFVWRQRQMVGTNIGSPNGYVPFVLTSDKLMPTSHHVGQRINPYRRDVCQDEAFIFPTDVGGYADLIESIYPGGQHFYRDYLHRHDPQRLRAYRLTGDQIRARQGLQQTPDGDRGAWYVPSSGQFLVRLAGTSSDEFVRISGETVFDGSDSTQLQLVSGWYPIHLPVGSADRLEVAFVNHHDWQPVQPPHLIGWTQAGGLRGEFWNRVVHADQLINENPAPVISRVDQAIAYHWTAHKDPELQGMSFRPPMTMQWVGKIRITEPGQYRFDVEGNGTPTLVIGGEQVISRTPFHRHDHVVVGSSVHLDPGEHEFRFIYEIERLTGYEQYKCNLFWTPPGAPPTGEFRPLDHLAHVLEQFPFNMLLLQSDRQQLRQRQENYLRSPVPIRTLLPAEHLIPALTR